MVFEYWEFDGGHTVFQRSSDSDEYQQQREQYDLTDDECELVWTFDAESFNAAMQMVYDRKGWGHYRTMEEEEDGK